MLCTNQVNAAPFVIDSARIDQIVSESKELCHHFGPAQSHENIAVIGHLAVPFNEVCSGCGEIQKIDKVKEARNLHTPEQKEEHCKIDQSVKQRR